MIELLPMVEAEIALLPPGEGGRKRPLVRAEHSHYRPHIVIGAVSQRKAIVVGRTLTEEYLGVEILHDQDLNCPHLPAPSGTPSLELRTKPDQDK